MSADLASGGDLVAMQIDEKVEMRRFVRTNEGEMLQTEAEKWVGERPRRVRAGADNVSVVGVEIASMTTHGSRKRLDRERKRARRQNAGVNAGSEC